MYFFKTKRYLVVQILELKKRIKIKDKRIKRSDWLLGQARIKDEAFKKFIAALDATKTTKFQSKLINNIKKELNDV